MGLRQAGRCTRPPSSSRRGGLFGSASAAFADADDGSSGIVIVRQCSGCESGSCSGGLCSDGTLCLPYLCEDGSDCGAGGFGKCDDTSACERTRHGRRCTADGFGDGCPETEACRTDALYFGSEAKCIYSLDPREPYCRVWNETEEQFEYVASSWDECGLRDAPRPSATASPWIDRCGGPCEDGSDCGDGGANKCADGVACTTTYTELCPENAACVEGFCDVEGDPIPCDTTCYYALGFPAACPSGAGRCGSGGRGLCNDATSTTPATRCLFDTCEDGSLCDEGLCGDGAPCDILTTECPSGAAFCGDGGPGRCGDTERTPCFRPKGDRAGGSPREPPTSRPRPSRAARGTRGCTSTT